MLVKILLELVGYYNALCKAMNPDPHTKSKSQWSKSNNPNHAKILKWNLLLHRYASHSS